MVLNVRLWEILRRREKEKFTSCFQPLAEVIYASQHLYQKLQLNPLNEMIDKVNLHQYSKKKKKERKTKHSRACQLMCFDSHGEGQGMHVECLKHQHNCSNYKSYICIKDTYIEEYLSKNLNKKHINGTRMCMCMYLTMRN